MDSYGPSAERRAAVNIRPDSGLSTKVAEWFEGDPVERMRSDEIGVFVQSPDSERGYAELNRPN